MNEKIKQLALEAGIGFTLWDDSGREMIDNYTPEEQLEKFAELLVLECINSVMDGTKEGDHYAMRIEQHFDNGPGGILHFGIEE